MEVERREWNVESCTRLSAVHCRGGDSRARHCTGGKCGPMLKRQWPPSLSLRGGRRPTWQSREGSCVFADSFPMMRPGTARLHPKGTSSRFALRAPRPRWGLAMTNPEALRRRITKNAPRMRRCPDQNVMGRCGRSAPPHGGIFRTVRGSFTPRGALDTGYGFHFLFELAVRSALARCRKMFQDCVRFQYAPARQNNARRVGSFFLHFRRNFP